MENEDTRSRPAEGVKERFFKCQYCDRMFLTSQALGGHQNGHRSEREAVKRAQCEAELRALGRLPPSPAFPSLGLMNSYLYAAQASHRPRFYSPSRAASRPSYHPYLLPSRFRNSGNSYDGAEPRFGRRFSSACSSAGLQRDESQWTLMGEGTAPAATVAGPSPSTNMNTTAQREGSEVEDGNNDCNTEIDLTLRL